jgi:hypothetical protein
VTAQRARYRAGTLTYTARLQQRMAPRPQKKAPAWLHNRWPVALLALGAEAGHLAAAVAEWPTSTPRGVFHILAAACQGLAAVALYFGLIRFEANLALALNALTAFSWPIGGLVGVSPYQHYPVLAAAAVSGVEAALAVMIIILCRIPKPNQAHERATDKHRVRR